VSALFVGQKVRVHYQRWTPQGWEPASDIATVINPCVTNYPPYDGDVEVDVDGCENRLFYGRANIEPIETAPNPFRDLRDDTHQLVEAMLYDLQGSSDDGDQVANWIDQWRAARGEAGMHDWRWWIGGTDDDIYALDFATRDEAIAAAPRAIQHGDINSFDGHFRIVEARCWADNLDEGKDEFPFADRRNAETLPLAAGGDQ
jgi:hypothetical protein